MLISLNVFELKLNWIATFIDRMKRSFWTPLKQYLTSWFELNNRRSIDFIEWCKKITLARTLPLRNFLFILVELNSRYACCKIIYFRYRRFFYWLLSFFWILIWLLYKIIRLLGLIIGSICDLNEVFLWSKRLVWSICLSICLNTMIFYFNFDSTVLVCLYFWDNIF